jgi:uncharacterized protein YjcR
LLEETVVRKDDINKLPKIGDEAESQCFALYCAGWKPAEIADEAKINFNTLRQWIMKGKWTEKKTAIDAARKEKNPPMSQPLMRIAATSEKDTHRKTFLEKTGHMAAKDAEYWNDMDPQERLVVAQNIGALNKVYRDNLGLSKDEESAERGHISLHFLTSADQPGFVKIIESEKVVEIDQDV